MCVFVELHGRFMVNRVGICVAAIGLEDCVGLGGVEAWVVGGCFSQELQSRKFDVAGLEASSLI